MIKNISLIPIEQTVGKPEVSGGTSIDIVSSNNCGTSNINNHSGVVIIKYPESTILIPGDNEAPSWRALNENQKFVSAMKDADVFMASHHGRQSGYCGEIFQYKPKLCVVSDSRVQDTDARSRYSYHAEGWFIHHRNSSNTEKRYCLTTQ